MKKRFLATLAASALSLIIATSPALAAQTDDEVDQNVATRDQLVELVTAKVEEAYGGVEDTVTDLVTTTLQGMIGNPQAVKDLATPLIKAAVKGAIAQVVQDERIDAVIDSAVDSVAEAEIVNQVLTNEFVTAVLNRAIAYAVDDIVAQLAIAADQQGTVDSIVNQVWQAPRVAVGTAQTKVKSELGSPVYVLGVLAVNQTYYSWNVNSWNRESKCIGIVIGGRCIGSTQNVNTTPSDITVTGWNGNAIGLLASGAATINAASKYDSILSTLQNIDYVDVIMNAAWRALQDEIRERVEAAILAAKTKLLDALTRELAKIGVMVTLDPAADWANLGAAVRDGLLAKAGAELDAALAGLPIVIVPGEPGDSFWEVLENSARASAAQLIRSLLRVDWRSLFAGKSRAETAPSLTVTPVKKAITNTDLAAVNITAKTASGEVIPDAPAEAVVSYSLEPGCQFPTGEAPSRRTCTISVAFDGLTAQTSVEVFDPTALAAPIGGDVVPRAKLSAAAPEGWPTLTYKWTRNGSQFSTAATYTLPSTEKLGNTIGLTRSLSYQGLTLMGSAPSVTVHTGTAASLTLTAVTKAVSNAGGAQVTAAAKDAYGNTTAAAATDTVYSYDLGEGCSFEDGSGAAKRVCTVTGSFQGIEARVTLEVLDRSALDAPISGEAAPRAKLTAGKPDGFPTVTYRWYRNGTQFSTASTYTLPSTEKVGNQITVERTVKYQGLTISGTSAPVTVQLGAAATLTLTPVAKAVSNLGGAQVTAAAKDAYGNVLPDAAQATTYTYGDLGEGCAFDGGSGESRRVCTITGSYQGVSATTTVEVFDVTALSQPIIGSATPGSQLTANKPAGWPTVTYRWYRNGSQFSTASTYRLPSTEKAGNVITVQISLSYQGLKISGTSPALVVHS